MNFNCGNRSRFPDQASAVKAGVVFYHTLNRYPTYNDLMKNEHGNDTMPTGNRIRVLFGGIKTYRSCIYQALGVDTYPPPREYTAKCLTKGRLGCLRCDRKVCTNLERLCPACKKSHDFLHEDYGFWMNGSIITEEYVDIDEYGFD